MKKTSRNNISACWKNMLRPPASLPLNYVWTFLLFVIFIISSCRDNTQQEIHSTALNGKDYFTAKATIRHARGFSIEYHGNYKVVKILNFFGNKADTIKYLFVEKGTPVPEGFSDAQKIDIPIKSMIGMSSMHVALADFTESTDVLIGLGSLQYVSSKNVLRNISAGKVKEVGMEGSLNNELIISIHPDVVMTVGNSETKFSRNTTLTNAGVPVLVNAEWLETDPLARAEWVKLMAALVNKEDLVNKKFAEIEAEYERLAALAKKAVNKPGVIVGLPFKDTWFVPTGNSFIAQFLRDAGTSYNWSEVTGKGSLPLNFETVAPVALNADFWINVGEANTKADVAAQDNRFTYFKPYHLGNVYNFNKRMNNLGSNDYWESGAVNPQLVLADLIKIFHPELLPSYQLQYYKQLP